MGIEPSGAKKVRLAAEAMGFAIEHFDYEYDTEPTYYVANSDTHKEGDIKTPSKHIVAHKIVGYRTDAKVGFEAEYAPGFIWAKVVCPIGKPVELWADYAYGPAERKAYIYPAEYAERKEYERDAAYNDGESYILHQWRMTTAGEFTQWIDDYLAMWAPNHKALTPVRKSKEEKIAESESALLMGAEWSPGSE